MALNINGTTGISGVDGSASAPVLTGTDSNTGINFASDTVNINTGGVTRVIVDSSGNLRAGTITDSSGTNPSTATQIAQGRAKAWVNFNGTSTVAIRDSFNVSSITDHGAGDYTVNITSGALANANYCMTGGISWFSGQSRNILSVASIDSSNNTVAPTTTALRLESVNYGNGTKYDAEYVCISIFGD